VDRPIASRAPFGGYSLHWGGLQLLEIAIPSDVRIGESGQRIWIVRLDLNDHALVEQHLYPNDKSYHNHHADRMGLPVFSVDPRHFASVCNYLSRSRNRGTVFAPDVTDDTWIPSDSFHFIRIPPSKEIRRPSFTTSHTSSFFNSPDAL